MRIFQNFVQRIAFVLVIAAFATATADAKKPAQAEPSLAAPSEAVIERLGVPGPIAFNSESYALAWSSHPAKGADGTDIVEWSAHRYTTQPDGTGTVLVGIARRGYGEGAIDFLKSLKAVRQRDIEALSQLKIDVVAPTP